MVLAINRLTTNMRGINKSVDMSGASLAKFAKRAKANVAPPELMVRPTDSALLEVLGGSKLKRARRNAPAKIKRMVTTHNKGD